MSKEEKVAQRNIIAARDYKTHEAELREHFNQVCNSDKCKMAVES